jgi:L-arabinose isomerase
VINLKNYEIWFITGSQHLYGPETLKQVAKNSKTISDALQASGQSMAKVVWKPVAKTPGEILDVLRQASADEKCAGVVCWMHTFSPAKMWISGLRVLSKPMLHLHTQFNRDLPWETIDMDFMNLNQSAHGDREFGFIGARMGIRRKIVSGHWEDKTVQARVGAWSRVAVAWADAQDMRIARFGDNMREVAVTEGNKVSAEIQFGFATNGFGIGDLAKVVAAAKDKEIDALVAEYKSSYTIPDKSPAALDSIREAARIEVGLRKFLKEGGFKAFTDTFQDLHGIRQLPGVAAQRLMADGYGFGAEGDWKTAAMVRVMKVMAEGLKGGTSFMEDYTYHLRQGREKVLGAHMLEVCPTISSEKPSLEVHPLGIGGKEPPARLVFTADNGKALNASLIDLGSRFRLILNEVTAVPPEKKLPKLPVARVLWEAQPSLTVASEAWILAGGAHHTSYTTAVDTQYLLDFAEIAGIEAVVIDEKTDLRQFKNELRWNAAAFR